MGQPTEELLSKYTTQAQIIMVTNFDFNTSLLVIHLGNITVTRLTLTIESKTTSTGSALTEIPGNISEKLYYSFLHSQFQGYLCYLLFQY